ncbi:prolyl oligopeptidase family serine peptidase [Rhodanobacter sp. AS-Z3]|uniref:alpha/beta hydrolase family protein n=1 Tax=Rhodanobacter sp. AS-Z3 TaxID=3031330 RepID=UPI002479091A|nr:prolyl oligopeptidase family serine peptidase [Rhodanobacter sp. AS-Z3]WEN15877.1 prolyl oligopeptidase family serine peptidase [Rhodanobacter sp. AS-Z3]
MRYTFFQALLGGILATALAQGTAQAAEPIPVESLARLPALQSVSMSPDGKHLVGLIPSPKNADVTALATWDTDSLSSGPKMVTPSGHMEFIAAFALKADKVLAVARQEWTGDLGGCGEGKSMGATETFVVKNYLTSIDQKEFGEAFANDKRQVGVSKATERCLELAGTSSLVDMLPLDPDRVIISQLSQITWTSNYYLYNLKTKERELLFKGGNRASPSLFDSRTGKVLAKSQIEPIGGGYEQQVLLLNAKTGQFDLQPALTTKLSDRYSVTVNGIDDATGKYYVLTDQFSDKMQVRMYDPVAKKYDPEAVVADKNFSIGGLLFSTRVSNFNQIVGFVVDGPHRQVVYVEPALKGIQDSIKQAFPGQQVGISSYNDDLSRVLFTTESASDPVAYHLLLDKKQVANLGSSRSWIGKDLTIDESWVTYQARDGRQIPAILDLPVGWKQGDAPAPAIVMPHGGPWARDYEGWDVSGWIPMLTSRGYAVLRPQYRGTEGLGRELWLAGDKEWGLKMSDDLDDGAAWLVSQHIAAKNRMAIFGYSYGGFAAVAASVRSPSPFQCAIAGAPVANLGRLGTSWSDNRLQRILQGQTVKGMDPMKNADKAHLPIMLFDGTRDVRTPPAIHAHPFYEAVKDKVPAQFHWIADMPHSMPWYPRQQRETLNLILNYLAKDCGQVSQ